jgi:hypothetical protein
MTIFDSLESASKNVANADVFWLLDYLEEVIAAMSKPEKLVTAGRVYAAIAELCAERCELAIDEWEQKYNPTFPVIDEDVFAGLVYQSVSLNLDDFIEPKIYSRGSRVENQKSNLAEVVVESCSEELDVCDVIELSHEENILETLNEIENWMNNQRQNCYSLSQIVRATNFQKSTILLALLQGNFMWKQSGDFYGDFASISVSVSESLV